MSRRFDMTYVFDFIPKLLAYLNITLLIVGSSILLGLIIGMLVALPRLYNVPVLKRVSQVYISFFRGTPILIQLFLIYYGLPTILQWINIDISRVAVLYFVILAYALNSGAFVSEMIRASVSAVDRGQIEAAQSIGMSGYQTFTRIILPQALAISIPLFGNLVIGNLKDTSLAFTLGVMEMTGRSQTLGTATQHFVETYIALSLIYFVISMILEQGFLWLERRLHRHEAGAKQTSAVIRRKWLTRPVSALSKGGRSG
ncbi:Arginine ABC transporter permease protein [Paenibacillus nuruki]|uniref:Arginine ABC transporter permease protein n=1 Tax=Paenibacillus nuruki TaxID=1886670 RepID=A0A1E3L2G9_9BACL|nr:amino acid ABC transporter permease [Paenibacillus nuruki]ODP27811.1 Arginine ABC transporter permease protein [Paenibacillus nuruki]